MSEIRAAARKDDLIKHDLSQWLGMFGMIGATLSAAAPATALVRFALGAAGPAGWVLFAASIAVEWAIVKLAEQAASSAGGFLESGAIPGIREGSPDVYTNLRPASRLNDQLKCCGSTIAEGSEWVTVNSRAAARIGDRISCSGKVASASPDVQIGGPPTSYANQSEYYDTASRMLGLYSLARLTSTIARAGALDLTTEAGRRAYDALGAEAAEQVAGEALSSGFDQAWNWAAAD